MPVTTIDVRSRARGELIDVTAEVQRAIAASGITDGIAVVFNPHTTAGVTVQENTDPALRADVLGHLAKLVPQDPAFGHDEGNADAHLKASLVGSSVTLIVAGGRARLGTWQAVYFCEFDGPRSRRLDVQVIGAVGR